MKARSISGWLVLLALPLLVSVLLLAAGREEKAQTSGASQAMSVGLEDVKWEVMLPELGKDSPQITILRVDPHTQATQLMIRAPRAIHVPFHWHSANETHTMIRGVAVFEHAGKREKLGPGGFNYIPARMQHQAWLSDNALTFITVDSAWDITWVSGPPQKSDVGKAPPANK